MQKVIVSLLLRFLFLHSNAQHEGDNFISTHDAAQSIIAVANFGNTDQFTSLLVNFHQLGLDQAKATFHIPFILRYQEDQQLNSVEHIDIPGGKGYLIVVENKN